MTIESWLTAATEQLSMGEITTARLDALVLLEDALGINRAHLLAHPDRELSKDTENVLTSQLARRVQHEPLAFIRGKTEFYGREFIITPAVLEPRPESETIIELLLQYKELGPSLRIADVGTGSGALGITAKLELPAASVDLLEIDDQALEIAKANVIKFTTSINVIRSDLLAQSSQEYDVLLCNLPYVPDSHPINAAARHEPAVAIFGGSDGLHFYRKLFEQIKKMQNKPLLILSESLPSQHTALKALAEQYDYEQDKEDDFVQVFRRR